LVGRRRCLNGYTDNWELDGNQNVIVGKVLVHTTTESRLIRKKLQIKIGLKKYKVTAVEEIRDIVEMDIKEEQDGEWVEEEPVIGMEMMKKKSLIMMMTESRRRMSVFPIILVPTWFR
ncbi:hypothetical protein Tco_1138107, partial [Tanacetum coccineum]